MTVKNSKLIEILEYEMQISLSDINISSEDEKDISIDNVKVWYFIAEKTLRVIDSTLGANSYSAVNQLRYAGHHIIKAYEAKDDAEIEHRNLVEAYKHCKRAYFDTLDNYKITLGQYYKDVSPYLATSDNQEIFREIQVHLKNIDDARVNLDKRIEYYSYAQAHLVEVLKLVEKINDKLFESSNIKEFVDNNAELSKENIRLHKELQDIEIENNEENEGEDEEFSRKGLIFTIVMTLFLGVSTCSGIALDAVYSLKYKVDSGEVKPSFLIRKEIE